MALPARGGCAAPPQPISAAELASFRALDVANLAARGPSWVPMRALEGDGAAVAAGSGQCVARTRSGIVRDAAGRCIDLGVADTVAPAADGAHGHTPLQLWLAPAALRAAPEPYLVERASALSAALSARQFPSACAAAGRVFYMHELPEVGFGSIIEYAAMFLGRAQTIDAQLRLGERSSVAWTSASFCGARRSLACYFNLTSCCAPLVREADRRPLVLPRRRDPINIAVAGWHDLGGAWAAAQLVGFLFDRLQPRAREAIAARRATARFPPQPAAPWREAASARPLVIGMHIRRGDSCHAGRFCPANLTHSYFAAAARLRARYGANRLLLATDDRVAARLCRGGALGFDCSTQTIRREKFESATFIEHRVARHDEGELSGAVVALDALADIDMLADADMHVLVLRSCLSRVAYALSLARKGRPSPLISLEAPWAPHHAKRALAGQRVGRGGGRHRPKFLPPTHSASEAEPNEFSLRKTRAQV